MTKDEMTIFIKKVAGLSVEDDEANLVIPDQPDDEDEWKADLANALNQFSS